MLRRCVDQHSAWNRQQNDFMMAQGQELVRLAEAVARLEQGAAMKLRTCLNHRQMSSPTSLLMLSACIRLRVLADTTQQMTACCGALMRCIASSGYMYGSGTESS